MNILPKTCLLAQHDFTWRSFLNFLCRVYCDVFNAHYGDEFFNLWNEIKFLGLQSMNFYVLNISLFHSETPIFHSETKKLAQSIL